MKNWRVTKILTPCIGSVITDGKHKFTVYGEENARSFCKYLNDLKNDLKFEPNEHSLDILFIDWKCGVPHNFRHAPVTIKILKERTEKAKKALKEIARKNSIKYIAEIEDGLLDASSKGQVTYEITLHLACDVDLIKQYFSNSTRGISITRIIKSGNDVSLTFDWS